MHKLKPRYFLLLGVEILHKSKEELTYKAIEIQWKTVSCPSTILLLK
jgi:hypothetical protein